jgi:hypothetical protein
MFMAIKVTCSCGTVLAADEKFVGKRVRCPKCGNVFQVPPPEVEAVEAEPSPQPVRSQPAPKAPARPAAASTRPSPPATDPNVPAPPRVAGTLNHDSPLVRYERLLTITGGRTPREHLRLRKAVLTRPGGQTKWFVDVVLTDVGLLVVPMVHHNSANTQAAAVHFGLIGALVAAGVASVQYHKDAKKYDEVSQQREDHSLHDLYVEGTGPTGNGRLQSQGPKLQPAEHRGAELLPADEIIDIRFKSSKVLVVRCRGFTYNFARHDDKGANRAEEWEQVKEHLNDWKEMAIQEIQERAGGPPEPGIVSLVEWGWRPALTVPGWVPPAVDTVAAEGVTSKTLKLFLPIPWEAIGRLTGKLQRLATQPSEDLAQQLEGLMSGKSQPFVIGGMITLAFGLLLGLVFLAMLGLEGGNMQGPEILLLIIGGVGLLIGIICWVHGWNIQKAFRKGLREVTEEGA